jgi:hypothetical protein
MKALFSLALDVFALFMYISSIGFVAQLGERHVRKEEIDF